MPAPTACKKIMAGIKKQKNQTTEKAKNLFFLFSETKNVVKSPKTIKKEKTNFELKRLTDNSKT